MSECAESVVLIEFRCCCGGIPITNIRQNLDEYDAGLALSRAGRAPSLLARAEPNLTSARSLMRDSAWRAEPRASHYNGSARLAVTPRWLARSRLAEPICVTYISCVSAQSRLNCMLPSQHSQVYRIHELIESCNIQFTRLNDN